MNDVTLAVECDSQASVGLSADLQAAANSQVVSAQKKHLDGSPASTLQIVQVAASMMAAVAPIIAAYISNRRVKKIKLGSIEIENPTSEQWETLWKQYLSQESFPKG